MTNIDECGICRGCGTKVMDSPDDPQPIRCECQRRFDSMTRDEALERASRNGMTVIDGRLLMPDRDSVPSGVWRECMALYRVISAGYTYRDPSIEWVTCYRDPEDNQPLD